MASSTAASRGVAAAAEPHGRRQATIPQGEVEAVNRWGRARAAGRSTLLCSECHGKGLVGGGGEPRLCEECGGLAVLHCCEGLTEQPLPEGLAGRSDGRDEGG